MHLVLAAIVANTVCKTPIPLKKYVGEKSNVVVYASAFARASSNIPTNVIIDFTNNVDTSFPGALCDNGITKIPVYFSSNAFWFPCQEGQTETNARINDFAQNVILTPSSLYMGNIKQLHVGDKIAEARCTNLQACKFFIDDSSSFFVTYSTNYHTLPSKAAIKDNKLVLSSIVVDLSDFNSYKIDPSRQHFTISIPRTTWIVQSNQTHFTLYEKGDSIRSNAIRLFSMFVLLIGCVIFIPNSSKITRWVIAKQYDMAYHIISGKEVVQDNSDVVNDRLSSKTSSEQIVYEASYFNVIMIDFSVSGLMVVFYQVSSTVYGSTFAPSRLYDSEEWVDYFYMGLVAVSSLIVVIITIKFQLIKGDKTTFLKNVRWVTVCKNAMSRAFLYCFSKTPQPYEIIAVRLCFEYVIVGGFLSCSPSTMDDGFTRAVFFVTSCTILYALGRDMYLILHMIFKGTIAYTTAQKWLITYSVVLFVAMASLPMIVYGIAPVCRDSSAVPNGLVYEISISVPVAFSFICIGIFSTLLHEYS